MRKRRNRGTWSAFPKKASLGNGTETHCPLCSLRPSTQPVILTAWEELMKKNPAVTARIALDSTPLPLQSEPSCQVVTLTDVPPAFSSHGLTSLLQNEPGYIGAAYVSTASRKPNHLKWLFE